ncbi:MAG: MmcQ/YjbR family DNA-binding protein [Vicinamibacterales bacterium]
MSFDTVRDMGLALPGVEDGTTYGSPALKVRGKMFACLAIHRSAEPESLVVRIDFDERRELIAADPATYYITDHYVNYPAMLVRLRRVHPDALRDLLLTAWRFTSRRPNRPSPQRTRPRRRE